jgi:hypothetical protein
MQLLLQMHVSEKTTAERSAQLTIEGESTADFASEIFSLDETIPEAPLLGGDGLSVKSDPVHSAQTAEGKDGFVVEGQKAAGILVDVEGDASVTTPFAATAMQVEAISKGENTGSFPVSELKPSLVSTMPPQEKNASAVLPVVVNRPQDGRQMPVDASSESKVEAIRPVPLEQAPPKDTTLREVKSDPQTQRTAPVLADQLPAMQMPLKKKMPLDGNVVPVPAAPKTVPSDTKLPAMPVVDRSEQQNQKQPSMSLPVIAPAKGDMGETRFEIRRHRTKQTVTEATLAAPKPTNQSPPATASPPSFAAMSAMPERPVFLESSVSRDPLFPVAIDPTGAGAVEGAEEKRPLQPLPKADQMVRPVVQQVTQGIMRSNLEGSVEVRLWPEELGKVRLAMTPSDVGLTVMVTAERPETLDLMRRHIDLLEADLRENGFDGLAFQFADAHDQQAGTDNASVRSDDDRLPATGEHTLTTTEIVSSGLVDGRLDIRV